MIRLPVGQERDDFDFAAIERTFGTPVATRVFQRLDDLRAFVSVKQVRSLRSAELTILKEPPCHFAVLVADPITLVFRATTVLPRCDDADDITIVALVAA